MRIDKDFEGGNIEVLEIDGDTARLACELRDTEGDWFYWAFRVRGAQGRRVFFDFGDKTRVGYFGAAVSRDNASWRWTETANDAYTGFSYDFPEDADEVFFCHDIRYGTAQFDALAASLGLSLQTLTTSEAGRPVPYAQFGEGDDVMFLFARHHACESTGNYVLEGILRELHEQPIHGLRTCVVPFVDLDGVVQGDQGKNRRPHDHNRDYGDMPIYASVAAIKALAKERHVIYSFDLHSPWHFGGIHDVCLQVRKKKAMRPVQARFGQIMEEEAALDPGAFQYRTANDLDVNQDWNIEADMETSCSGFFANLPGARLVLSLETPYFGTRENVATAERIVRLGRCMGRAIRRAYAEGI